jgi:hypothetical protein
MTEYCDHVVRTGEERNVKNLLVSSLHKRFARLKGKDNIGGICMCRRQQLNADTVVGGNLQREETIYET